MGQDRLVGRAATRAAGLQEGGLEPAPRLVGALQIEVGRPAAVVAAFQREGVGRAAVEPDVQDVLDLLVVLGVPVRAQEVGGGAGEPGVGAFLRDRLLDPAVHLGVLKRLARGPLHEHGERRAPCALARDQPVGPPPHHGADAGLAGHGVKGGGVEGGQRPIAQRRAALDRFVHANEPLRRVAVEHRGLGAPRMRIAVGHP